MHLFEETNSSQPVYNGKIFDVICDTVTLENDTQAKREVVLHNGGVCVVPVTDDNQLLLVRQFRYPFREVLTEVPAGKLNKGEDHLECGKRELLEETGACADTFTDMGIIYPTPAYLTEKIHMYIASGLKFEKQNLDEDEFLDVIKVPFEEALEMVMKNEIKDAKTQIAIMKAWLVLSKK
ncbi:MAG: NUDIX hydrolase [Oscillospiraceae bacterium]|nr:NUDIX hydrolase [Oscillospiraceae bacterium]